MEYREAVAPENFEHLPNVAYGGLCLPDTEWSPFPYKIVLHINNEQCGPRHRTACGCGSEKKGAVETSPQKQVVQDHDL